MCHGAGVNRLRILVTNPPLGARVSTSRSRWLPSAALLFGLLGTLGCPGDDTGASDADSDSTTGGPTSDDTDTGPGAADDTTAGENDGTVSDGDTTMSLDGGTLDTGDTDVDTGTDTATEGTTGDPGCPVGAVDCPCTAGGSCDAGLACDDTMTCVTPVCGDGVSQGEETCDDDNTEPGDGCTATCQVEVVVQVAVGLSHSCALLSGGVVRCWGRAEGGRLGNGAVADIGDDEPASASALVDLGGVATQISAGVAHSCAVMETGAVRCWGEGDNGRLGYGDTADVPVPAAAGDVPLGGTALQVSAGEAHTCAVLDDGAVRCWGEGDNGRLGYAATADIGDDEDPSTAGDVDVGGLVQEIATGNLHTCALLDDGALRCWGSSAAIGYGTGAVVGDDETPASVGDVPVGGTVVQIAAAGGNGGNRTCALMDDGGVRCWGLSAFAPLGYGNFEDIGDDDTPGDAGDIDLGGVATAVAVGPFHQCALLDTGSMRCWGLGSRGRLGYASPVTVGGDASLPSDAGDINVGASVVQISARGGASTCAVLDSGALRCWGADTYGQPGYGVPGDIGDDETPSSVGDVPLQ